MNAYTITYLMYPEENIKVTVTTKTEEEAIIYAKECRKDAFMIKKEKKDEG